MKVVGIDPGYKTGVVFCDVSDEGNVIGGVLLQHDTFEIGRMACVRGGLDGGDGSDWWEIMRLGSMDLMWRIEQKVTEWLDQGAGGEVVLIVLEDFVLSPTKVRAGVGGRDAVAPVAVGSILWQQFGDFFGSEDMVLRMISSPSSKSAVGNDLVERIRRGMDGMAGGKQSDHCKDALRHAILGIRRYLV